MNLSLLCGQSGWGAWEGPGLHHNSRTCRSPSCFLFLVTVMDVSVLRLLPGGPQSPLCPWSPSLLPKCCPPCQPWNHWAGSTPKTRVCTAPGLWAHVPPGVSATLRFHRPGLHRGCPVSRMWSCGDPLMKHTLSSSDFETSVGWDSGFRKWWFGI